MCGGVYRDMKENCQMCSGKGTVDIMQTWHELTVWCPECETKKYEDARMVYKKNYGIDFSNDVDDAVITKKDQKDRVIKKC